MRRTQFGRAMKQLGVEMIPGYSPEARGRSERAFRTHQGRLPKELAAAGITSMAEANRYITDVYLPAHNEEFQQPPREDGSAFVALGAPAMLDDILCQEHERVVGRDNCVRFEGVTLQIPADRHRCHYIKAKVKVRQHMNGAISISHGPRRLATPSITDTRVRMISFIKSMCWRPSASGNPGVSVRPRCI